MVTSSSFESVPCAVSTLSTLSHFSSHTPQHIYHQRPCSQNTQTVNLLVFSNQTQQAPTRPSYSVGSSPLWICVWSVIGGRSLLASGSTGAGAGGASAGAGSGDFGASATGNAGRTSVAVGCGTGGDSGGDAGAAAGAPLFLLMSGRLLLEWLGPSCAHHDGEGVGVSEVVVVCGL